MNEVIIIISIVISAAFLGRGFRKLSLKDMIVLALFMALSVIGRYLVSFVPSVQPSSYFIIISAALYGPAAGFFVGIGTAILSNLMLGFGSFVAWQMLGWGLMGLLAGCFAEKGRAFFSVYGFIWGFLFGWITNFWWISIGALPFTVYTVLGGAASSFLFDLAHALTNFGLLILLPPSLIRKLLKQQPKEISK